MPRRLVALTLALLAAAALPASAQYFGRNKVQYADFDFRILETPHFDIYYYPSEREAVVQAGRLAERWYARLSRALDDKFRERQPIVLYASHAHFEQTNIIPGFLDDGIGGITEHLRGRVVLPFAAGLGETDHVLGHELVHAFQRDILKKAGRSMATLPLWFVEGMAEYLSVGRIDPNTLMWLRDAADQDHLPTIAQLDDPRWFPYRYGQALWAYLAGRFSEDIVARCLKSKAGGGAIGRLVRVTGVDAKTLSADWQASIKAMAERPDPEPRANLGTTIISSDANGGRLNVGPALSPDGHELVFLSERDRYAIDMFVADAANGTVLRKIIRTEGDPHFDTLEFIDSAGAWDASGTRFALAAMYRGKPELTIIDMRSGAIRREIQLPGLDQIYSPTWAPDGRRLAFSALKGGLSDLYSYDLDSGTLQPLTNDAFADLQPAWSPDGRTIVFSTDRFSSSLDTLSWGNYRLAALDVASGAIRELPSIPGAKNIDPHWAHDGQELFFVADAGGVSNVYRVSLASGELSQVTSVATGVSGVMALSPALSVSADGRRVAFSVYRKGAFEIRTLEDPADETILAARPVESSSPVAAPAAAPAVSGAVAPPTFGLLDGRGFAVKPYHHGMTLDGISQPYFSAGGGAFGSFFAAGVSFSLGDMLADQQLATALQVGKSLSDFAAQTTYVNLRSRWNWGFSVGQIPALIGASNLAVPSAAGDNTIARESLVYRQIHRELAGIVMYPFSRSDRIEMTGGVHTISFDRETTTDRYSPVTGNLIDETDGHAPVAPAVRLFESSLALVHDSSLFGATSPVLGDRYRLELAPTFGDLRYTTVIADYRKYVMPVRPFTIAMRVDHVGRYGPDAGDPRLLPLVWTLRDYVRGYGDTQAFANGACSAPASAAECAPVEYLSARRLLVGNVELRFPLLAPLHRDASYGRLPLEGLVFADAGTFWSGTALPASPTRRFTLRSVGAGVRLNAAGLVFEFDAVKPFDTTPNGWTFAFNFLPGF